LVNIWWEVSSSSSSHGQGGGTGEVMEKDRALLENLLEDYCKDFSKYGLDPQEIGVLGKQV